MQTYIDRGGELCTNRPFVSEEVEYYGFILDADKKKLQDLCDRYLNSAIGSAGRFVPAAGFVLFACCNLQDLECWPSAPNLDQLVEGEEIRNLDGHLGGHERADRTRSVSAVFKYQEHFLFLRPAGKIVGNVLVGNAPLKDVWGYGDL